jgi:hypothetical protein
MRGSRWTGIDLSEWRVWGIFLIVTLSGALSATKGL